MPKRKAPAKPAKTAKAAKTGRAGKPAKAERAEKVEKNEEPAEQAGRGSFWSGTITFGLVSVPVYLYPAHRADRISLRMLGPDGNPVARRYFCEQEGRQVGGDHLVRGFETEPGKHVVVTDEEMERLAPKKTRDIELRRFVDVGKLDPIRFDRPYFLTPGSENAKAYRLLASVMERTKRAGIATFVMHGRERIVAILAEGGILRAQTLRFSDEIRTPQEIGLPEPVKPDRAAVEGFERSIAGKAKSKIEADEMDDPYLDALKKLVETKRRDAPRVVSRAAASDDDEDGNEPIDLVEVLKRSLKQGGAASGATKRTAASRERASASRRAAPGAPARSSASGRGRIRRA